LDHVDEFWQSVHHVQQDVPFDLLAWVILPDHFHAIIWSREGAISDIVRRIKQKFAGLYRSKHGQMHGRLWQHRFWDHIIRDVEDLNRHLDYIHINPVKHGIADDPFKYPHSSMSKFAKQEMYPLNWGVREAVAIEGEFGE
jgi:putative transposase